ncbi:ABC transporter substrate-binding protein [Microbacterium kribbense]|uniref:ABC transporter substrate-binding protein n=2 Tax=Microbacterium kribbense TaxID=433645 RepID=A0ABP7H0I7_9MICO
MAATVAAITVAAVALAGCSSGGSGGSGSVKAGEGTLTIGTIVASSTFAVDDAPWANESPYLQAVYDSLLHQDPDGTVKPWLATEWSYNADNTVLTMKLRDDVTFTDGTKFDASVAAQNLLRFRDGASPQKAYLAQLKDVKAVDATTLQLTLSSPNPALLSFLAQNPGLQESPKHFGAADEKTNPVGSGPYVLDKGATVVGSKYVFAKNKDYWAPDQQHYAKLVMNVYSTPTAILNAIKGHQIDGAPLVDNSTIKQVESAGYKANGQTLNFTGLLLFDREGKLSPALADVRVRQAINYAFDRDALLKAVGHGYGEVTSSIISPASTGGDPSLDSYYSYDPGKAKQLLKEAGYAAGEITLTQPQSAAFPPAVYALVKQYLGDIGINVKFVSVASSSFLADLLAAKYSSTVMQLQTTPTVWQSLALDLLPNAGWNPFHVGDAKIAGFAKTIQSGSDAEAAAAAKELNKYVVEQAWFAPWYRPQQTYATAPTTTVKTQTGNAYPYLWNFVPKG